MPDSIIQFRDAQTLAAVILKAAPGAPHQNAVGPAPNPPHRLPHGLPRLEIRAYDPAPSSPTRA